jgi:hypothetical protein
VKEKVEEEEEEAREQEREKAEKEGEGGGVRGRGDSASQPRLPLLLSRQGAAEGLRPPVVVHPLGRLGVDDL